MEPNPAGGTATEHVPRAEVPGRAGARTVTSASLGVLLEDSWSRTELLSLTRRHQEA